MDRTACTVDVRGNEETLALAPGSVFAHTVVNAEAMQESLLALGQRFLASPSRAKGSCGRGLLLREPGESFDEDPFVESFRSTATSWPFRDRPVPERLAPARA